MSYSTTTHGESIRPKYKPVILRTASLLCLLLLTLGLIGLLEYGVRTLPHGNGRNSLVSRSVVLDQSYEHQVLARQVESGLETPSAEPIDAPVEPIDTPVQPIDTPAEPIVEKPTTPIVTQSLPKDDYIPTETLASSADENDFIPTVVVENPGTWETIGSDFGPSDYVPTGGGEYAPPSDYISPSDHVPTIASSAAGSDYIPPKQTGKPEDQQAAAPKDQQAATPKDQQAAAPGGKQNATPAPTPKPVVVVSYSSHAVVATIQTTLAPGSAPGSDYVQPSGGVLTTSYEVFPMTMTVDGTDPDASGSPLEAEIIGKDGQKVVIVSYWNHVQVFYGTFLAVLLAVLYRILYSVLHSNLVLIDPFRQLLDSRGAPAEKSFFSFYQNPSIVFGPFPALMKGSNLGGHQLGLQESRT
ncbi:hypothetical protein BST61_g3208 [Cercospora zeina]